MPKRRTGDDGNLQAARALGEHLVGRDPVGTGLALAEVAEHDSGKTGEVSAETSGVAWSADELKVLSLVDGRRTLRDLITAGPGDVSANAKLVYAFWVLHLVTRRDVNTSGIKRIQWKTTSGGHPVTGGG